MDIKNQNLTFHEARRPWDQWGIRETLGAVNPAWRNCTPSDIDSVIELNGHFLFIEDKPESQRFEIGLMDGQMRMYHNLLALSEKVSVWVLIGSRDNPVAVYSVKRGEIKHINGKDELMHLIKQWAQHVDNKSKGF
jgi:hypothetical protein